MTNCAVLVRWFEGIRVALGGRFHGVSGQSFNSVTTVRWYRTLSRVQQLQHIS